MDFQRYNIKEKQKEKGRKKKKRIIKKQTKQNTNNHPKSIYGVCLKKKKSLFLKKNSNTRL